MKQKLVNMEPIKYDGHTFYPYDNNGEILCLPYDYKEYAKELLPDAKEQEIANDRFNYIESCIYKKSYKDVRIPIGEDNLIDCIESILSAKDLQKHNFIVDDKEIWFEIGNFNHCYDLEHPEDLTKTYRCRLLKTWDDFFKEYKYELKSVSEL